METKKHLVKKDLFSKKRALSFDEALGSLGIYKSSIKKVKQNKKTISKQAV